MAKDPAERYASAAALRDDLRHARTLPDAATPVDRAPAHVRRPAAASPSASWSIGVLVLVALIAGGVSLRRCSAVTATSRRPTRRPYAVERPRRSPTLLRPVRLRRRRLCDAGPTGSDEEVAIANVAQAFEDAGTMNEAQAQCAAEQWVQHARACSR